VFNGNLLLSSKPSGIGVNFSLSFLLPVTTDQNLLKITVPSNPSA